MRRIFSLATMTIGSLICFTFTVYNQIPVLPETLPEKLIKNPVETEQRLKPDENIATSSFTAEKFFVDELTAKKTALAFMTSALKITRLKNADDLELVFKSNGSKSLKKSSGLNPEELVFYYVFSSSASRAYVIISGDKRAIPVLAYSTTVAFDPDNIPPNLLDWLKVYEEQIRYAREQDLKIGREAGNEWLKGMRGEISARTPVVSPLLSTQWAQDPYYNDMCPYISSVEDNAKAGCLATAMAQIMKYWEYPERGEGSNSYIPEYYPELGPLTVDFGKAVYDWKKMPFSVDYRNQEVAKIIYHCGVSTNMDYREDISWASINEYNHPSALLAFVNHFGYKQKCSFERKRNYSDNQWLDLVTADLDAGRPLLYSGGGEDFQNAGHIFVCDGYDSNYFLHFNFGWGGVADGYFSTYAVSLFGIFDYTDSQMVLAGLEPKTNDPEPDLRTSSKLQISPSNFLQYKEGFTVQVKFRNFGAKYFIGTLMAALYDSNNKYFGLIDTPKSVMLGPGTETDKVTFSTEGMEEMVPGEYSLVFVTILPDESTAFVYGSVNAQFVSNSLLKIKVLGNDEGINSDEFEDNNSIDRAVELTPEFTDQKASVFLSPTIHDINDIDFFKLKLTGGYQYHVSSLLTDNQTDASKMFDGKYSYKTGSGHWSVPEDVDIPDFRLSAQDSVLYFKVEPYFRGFRGSYELAIDITKEEGNATSIAVTPETSVKIYPSPNDGRFTLEMGREFLGDNEISIINCSGKIISQVQVTNSGSISRSFRFSLPAGIYFIRIRNLDKVYVQKMVVYSGMQW